MVGIEPTSQRLIMAGAAGLEPTTHESKSCVLPLHHAPIFMNYKFLASQPKFFTLETFLPLSSSYYRQVGIALDCIADKQLIYNKEILVASRFANRTSAV